MPNPHLEEYEAKAKADVSTATNWFKANWYPFAVGVGSCLVVVKLAHLLGLLKFL